MKYYIFMAACCCTCVGVTKYCIWLKTALTLPNTTLDPPLSNTHRSCISELCQKFCQHIWSLSYVKPISKLNNIYYCVYCHLLLFLSDTQHNEVKIWTRIKQLMLLLCLYCYCRVCVSYDMFITTWMLFQ